MNMGDEPLKSKLPSNPHGLLKIRLLVQALKAQHLLLTHHMLLNVGIYLIHDQLLLSPWKIRIIGVGWQVIELLRPHPTKLDLPHAQNSGQGVKMSSLGLFFIIKTT